MLVPILITFAILAFATRNAGVGSTGGLKVSNFGYQTLIWEPIIQAVTYGDPLLIQFHKAWIEKESGGNPCAIGKKGAKGPDGSPREMGIYQLYNPDDLKATGATGAKLRAYCSGDGQHCSRQLTSEEMADQVRWGSMLINRCRASAGAVLSSVHAGAQWSPDAGPDYWRCVKLAHALPGLLRTGMREVTRALGRPPGSWSEFRAVVMTIDFSHDDPNTWGYHEEFPAILDNAEEVGGAVPARSQV